MPRSFLAKKFPPFFSKKDVRGVRTDNALSKIFRVASVLREGAHKKKKICPKTRLFFCCTPPLPPDPTAGWVGQSSQMARPLTMLRWAWLAGYATMAHPPPILYNLWSIAGVSLGHPSITHRTSLKIPSTNHSSWQLLWFSAGLAGSWLNQPHSTTNHSISGRIIH